jgi:hypothetical protein
MSTLKEFLVEAATELETRELVISDRLRKWPFTIRAMDNAQYTRFQRVCVTQKKGERKFDDAKMKVSMVAECTVQPHFADAEWLKQAGCGTPEQLVSKVLRPGEIERLAGEISLLSGFGQQLEEAVEEAKND